MRRARGISRSEAKRLAALAKKLGPGVAALRKLLANGWRPELLSRLLQELGLDPEKQIDCQILAASLAIYLIVERRGRPPWDRIRQAELLAEVHRHRQKSTTVLLDEQVCRLIAKDRKSPPYFRLSPRTMQPKGQGLIKQLRNARREFQANGLARAAFWLAFD